MTSGKGLPDRTPQHRALYNLGPAGAYPDPNTGVHAVTRRPADMVRFKPPSLRNIALTAP